MPNIPRPQSSHTSLVVVCIQSWLQAGLLREILFNKPKRHTFSGLYMWKTTPSVPDQILERITFSGPCMWTLFLLWAWYNFTFLYKLSCFLPWALQIKYKCTHANSWPQAVIHLCFFLAFVSFIVPLAFVSAFAFLLGKDRWLTHSDTFLFVCLFSSFLAFVFFVGKTQVV